MTSGTAAPSDSPPGLAEGAMAPRTAQGRRIAELLSDQRWSDADAVVGEAWIEVANCLACAFEALARASQNPELLQDMVLGLERAGRLLLDPAAARKRMERGREESGEARAFRGDYRDRQALHLELSLGGVAGAERRAAMRRDDGLGGVVTIAPEPAAGAMICAPLRSLPLVDDAADRARFAEGVESCLDLEAVLDEIFRVLRPGGGLHLRSPFLVARPPGRVRYSFGYIKAALAARGFTAIRMDGEEEPLSTLYALSLSLRPDPKLAAEAARDAAVVRAMLLALLGSLRPSEGLFRRQRSFYGWIDAYARKPGRLDARSEAPAVEEPWGPASLSGGLLSLLRCPLDGEPLAEVEPVGEAAGQVKSRRSGRIYGWEGSTLRLDRPLGG